MNADSFIVQMQLERYEIFKAQNSAKFDVTFEIDGKLIYANQYVLETISTTFNSMLSDRWKSKDEIIKLNTYSYDDFYQFLTFIYSGKCDMTEANVPTMIDMAEFYNITAFKEFCDKYISCVKFSIDNIFDLNDLVQKYSLPKSKAAINRYTCIEKLVTLKRDQGSEEKLFESVYKWAENQFITDENTVKQKM